MAAISQTVLSYAFSWIKSSVFLSKFHWSLFLRFQLTITQYLCKLWLGPNRQQAIIWTNADPNHWRIYAALRGRGWVNSSGVHKHCCYAIPKPHKRYSLMGYWPYWWHINIYITYALLLSHTEGILTHMYYITTVAVAYGQHTNSAVLYNHCMLSHTDETYNKHCCYLIQTARIITHQCYTRTVVISYWRPTNSPVWHKYRCCLIQTTC